MLLAYSRGRMEVERPPGNPAPGPGARSESAAGSPAGKALDMVGGLTYRSPRFLPYTAQTLFISIDCCIQRGSRQASGEWLEEDRGS
jgi:hypothetical protein